MQPIPVFGERNEALGVERKQWSLGQVFKRWTQEGFTCYLGKNRILESSYHPLNYGFEVDMCMGTLVQEGLKKREKSADVICEHFI